MVKFPLIRTVAGAMALTAAMLGSAAGAAPTNKQLTIGITQEFENLNPIIAQMAATTYLNLMASSPLVTINADWKWICVLCTELPTLENGGAKLIDEKGVKKLLVTWTIKPNAQWADGTPLT